MNPAGDCKSAMYFIDDGLYGSFNCVVYDHQIVTPTLLEVRGRGIHAILGSGGGGDACRVYY